MKKITDFATKKEFFSYLVANKKELIEFKKLAMKFADPFGADAVQAGVVKSLNTSHKDNVESGVIERSIIGNTYYWMDSHDDVHVDNTFAVSISQRQDKIWHLHDHLQQTTAKVGRPKSIYEKSVLWKDLNVDIPGSTICLFMDSTIVRDYNKAIFDQYLSKEINQHSVGMFYVQLDLAINDPEEKHEYATWNKYINLIGNKQKAIDQGFFWAVKEAKLVEISCVLAGSNELTPTVENKTAEIATEEPISFYAKVGKSLRS